MKKILFLAILATMIIQGCNNDDNDAKGILSVRLTDAPAEYEEVLIDLQELHIKVSSDDDDEDGWQSLELNTTGQIDLLLLTNGNDILLTEEDIPVGNIAQMRMILGSNNQIVVDGETHELATPSAEQSGLKFNIHANIEEGVTYKMWIDFDAV